MPPPTTNNSDSDRYLIPQSVLDETRLLLAEPGSAGLEAIVVWIGDRVDNTSRVLRPLRPHQYSIRDSDGGVTVIVPMEAITELVRQLDDNSFVVARLHSHPGAAYHSHLDDSNMLIAHDGAISIVVPNFAQDEINLQNCAVYQLNAGQWLQLTTPQILKRFIVDG